MTIDTTPWPTITEMEMHFATVWESIADAIPDQVAITHGDDSRTWAEFDDRSARVAQAFTDAGLGPDSKIALYMYNCNEYMEAHYAAFKMRGVAINVNYRYLDEELWYLLDNSDSEAIVFHRSLADRVASRRRPVAEAEADDRRRRRAGRRRAGRRGTTNRSSPTTHR